MKADGQGVRCSDDPELGFVKTLIPRLLRPPLMYSMNAQTISTLICERQNVKKQELGQRIMDYSIDGTVD